MLFPTTLILVRGAGDLATGILHRLHLAGFPLIATEVAQPLAIRRTVAFAQAVYERMQTVEGVTAVTSGLAGRGPNPGIFRRSADSADTGR